MSAARGIVPLLMVARSSTTRLPPLRARPAPGRPPRR